MNTRIKIVLQGKVESFQENEDRLNEMIIELEDGETGVICCPSASADGMMCTIINVVPR